MSINFPSNLYTNPYSFSIKQQEEKTHSIEPMELDTPEKEFFEGSPKSTAYEIYNMHALPENLEYFAIDLGFGYKAANLIVMQRVAHQLNQNLKCAMVRVPTFLPIADGELCEYLRKEVPEIFVLWDSFKQTFSPHFIKNYLEARTNQNAAKIEMDITTQGKYLLGQIENKITAHFAHHLYFTQQMENWLKENNPHFVIVRSSGKEDTETFSNAGGNASVPYVKPDKKSITQAIGMVLASYFSEKSIRQRILCGDRTLFTDSKPFLPVLLQEIVGESVGGLESRNEDIPRSGVLFTFQQSGAQGVTLIQTGLGNNEGVVTSKVGVDSYYVKDSKIHAVIRKKETRYVCTEDGKGKMIVAPIKNNQNALKCNAALSPEMILDLKQVADGISTHYAKDKASPKPLDIEYTVKLNEIGYDKPIIYILQVRPLLGTNSDKQLQPTYLDIKALKEIQNDRKIQAEVLLDGNSYVRKIVRKHSILFAPDLSKGTEDYKRSFEKIEAIIVGKTAPATSHEAVILRPEGIAVYVVQNPQEFSALKKKSNELSEDQPFFLDPQRGLIVSGLSGEASEQIIRKGLISYPISLEVSVPPSKIMQHYSEVQFVNEEIKKHIIQAKLKAFHQRFSKLVENLRENKPLFKLSQKGVEGGYEVNELVDMLATGPMQQARLALATLIQLMRVRFVKSLKETETPYAGINKPMFQVLEAALYLAQFEIAPALSAYPPESMERLYPIKFFDAMLHQKWNPQIIEGHSYFQVFAKDILQKNALDIGKQNGVNFQGKNSEELIYLQQMTAGAFNEKCKEDWQEFVRELSTLDATAAASLIAASLPLEGTYKSVTSDFISRLIALITQVNDLDICPLWINTDFKKAWNAPCCPQRKSNRVEKVLKKLESSMKSSQKTFRWILERTEALNIYEEGIYLWSDPAYCIKQTQKLIDDFLHVFGFNTVNSENCLSKKYSEGTPLGRLALLQYMRKAINIYDSSIKAAKGSVQFTTLRKQETQVAEMLKGYLSMLEAVFAFISEEEQMKIQAMGAEDLPFLFGEYIEILKNGHDYEFGDEGIFSSIGFNRLVTVIKKNEQIPTQFEINDHFLVSSLVIGSKADLNFSVHWPNNLEEYFTTFHQNMEQVIKYLNTLNGLDSSLLPDSAKNIVDKATNHFGDISYITFEHKKLLAGFQIPLRQHAAHFSIECETQKPESGVTVTFQIFGANEHDRWNQTAALGAILAYTFGNGFVSGKPPKINYFQPTGCEFAFTISPNTENIDLLMSTFGLIAYDLSMSWIGNSQTLITLIQTGINSDMVYQGLGDIDWSTLNPECFQYTLYINNTLIEQLMKQQKYETAAKVAINSIKGLSYYGLKDFYLDDNIRFDEVEDCLECDIVQNHHIPHKNTNPTSLLHSASQTLFRVIPIVPSIRSEVQSLVDDIGIHGQFQELCNQLKDLALSSNSS